MKRTYFTFAAVFALLSVFVLVSPVLAAGIFFTPPNIAVTDGAQFSENLYLDTGGVAINGIEGTLNYPADKLNVVEIRDGNSIANFWLKKPAVSSAGSISFSGVTAGGYTGSKGLLFSVIFRSKLVGSGALSMQGVRATADDGQATLVTVTLSTSAVTINEKKAVVPVPTPIPSKEPGKTPVSVPMPPAPVEGEISIVDTTPPELFAPTIASSPDLFEGRYFIAFVAQDKGVGIDHYEVCEGDGTTCVVVQSPYVLQNQKLDQPIFVKAYDKSGNERDIVVPPQKPKKWYENGYAYLAFVVVLMILDTLLFKKAIRRFFYDLFRPKQKRIVS
jgi:hypothetical protein